MAATHYRLCLRWSAQPDLKGENQGNLEAKYSTAIETPTTILYRGSSTKSTPMVPVEDRQGRKGVREEFGRGF